MSYYKLTDAYGDAFFTKNVEHRLEKGKLIQAKDVNREAECGNGIHFSNTPEGAISHGIEAAEWYSPEIFQEKGLKLWKIKANDAVKISGSVHDDQNKYKAAEIEVIEEIPLTEELLSRIFNNPDRYGGCVRCFLAAMPGLPPGLMNVISASSDMFIQEGLLMNPAYPVKIREGDEVELRPDYFYGVFNKNKEFTRGRLYKVKSIVEVKERGINCIATIIDNKGKEHPIGIGWLMKHTGPKEQVELLSRGV